MNREDMVAYSRGKTKWMQDRAATLLVSGKHGRPVSLNAPVRWQEVSLLLACGPCQLPRTYEVGFGQSSASAAQTARAREFQCQRVRMIRVPGRSILGITLVVWVKRLFARILREGCGILYRVGHESLHHKNRGIRTNPGRLAGQARRPFQG